MELCKIGTIKDISKYHLKYLGNQKFDGCRCIAICDEQVRLIGRAGTDYSSKFPEIVNELKGFKGIIDGEIACLDFDKTASRVHTENKLKLKILEKEYPAIFYIFDEINDKMLVERIRGLNLRGFKNLRYISLLPYTFDGVGLWEKAKQENWEGLIIKNPLSKYENKRSWNWLKIKKEITKDIVVTNYEINPAGIRVENKDLACQITGSNALIVKKQIDETGSCNICVKGLEITSLGKIRQITLKKVNGLN